MTRVKRFSCTPLASGALRPLCSREMAAALFFFYGLAAGFLVVRLRRSRAAAAPLWLLALAWVTMIASFALTGLIIGWAAWTGFASP